MLSIACAYLQDHNLSSCILNTNTFHNALQGEGFLGFPFHVLASPINKETCRVIISNLVIVFYLFVGIYQVVTRITLLPRVGP